MNFVKPFLDAGLRPLESPGSPILKRIRSVSLGILMPLIVVSDTVLGIVGGVGAILTLGFHKETVKFSCKHLESSAGLIVPLFGILLGECNITKEYQTFTTIVNAYLKKSISDCVGSPNWAHRHITSRLAHLVALAASVVTGVADGVTGMIMLGAACCTFGMVSHLNQRTFTYLENAGRCIGNIVISVLGIVNPQAVEEALRSHE